MDTTSSMKRSIDDVDAAETSSPKKARLRPNKLAFILIPQVFEAVRKTLDLVPSADDDFDDYSTVYTFTVGSAASVLQMEQMLEDMFVEYDPGQAHPEVVPDIPPFKLILDYLADRRAKMKAPSFLTSHNEAFATAPRSDLGEWTRDITYEGTEALKDGPYTAIYVAHFDELVHIFERDEEKELQG